MYTKQRDIYSCGPVAIINTLKWAGETFSYQDKINFFKRLCFCVKPYGTIHEDFNRALKKIVKKYKTLHVKKVLKPSLSQIDTHLKGGGAIILNYIADKNKERTRRHYVLVVSISRTGKSYVVVNDYVKGTATRRITRERFKALNLRFQRTDSAYKAWFIHNHNM